MGGGCTPEELHVHGGMARGWQSGGGEIPEKISPLKVVICCYFLYEEVLILLQIVIWRPGRGWQGFPGGLKSMIYIATVVILMGLG